MKSKLDPRYPILRAVYAILRANTRVQAGGELDVLEEAARGVPFIFASRHGQLLPLLWGVQPYGLTIVVSRSRDGELLAKLLRPYGFRFVRGSSSGGGRVAAREALALLRAGGRLGMAVDGPRGPRAHVQEGVLRLARSSGVPIVPLVARGGRAWVLRGSWDHFEIPHPGSRIEMRVGTPIRVGRGENGIAEAGVALAHALDGCWAGTRRELRSPTGTPSYGHP
jgi:lysophospholipid acyltransferase (LPLAT)-like uncharacterized protein